MIQECTKQLQWLVLQTDGGLAVTELAFGEMQLELRKPINLMLLGFDSGHQLLINQRSCRV